MTSLPVCHFRYDVTPHLHQSPFIPKSRGWLLSQSEPSHHNEALFPLFGHSFMTSLPVFHVRYDVTPRLHQSPSTPKSRGLASQQIRTLAPAFISDVTSCLSLPAWRHSPSPPITKTKLALSEGSPLTTKELQMPHWAGTLVWRKI